MEEGYNYASIKIEEEVAMVLDEETTNDDDFKGLRLVHFLMVAAEAHIGINKSRDLAWVILVRLKELVSHTNGTNMERLAAYFIDTLQGLLEGTSGAQNSHKHFICSGPHRDERLHIDILAMFQLLQDMLPYIKFTHFTVIRPS